VANEQNLIPFGSKGSKSEERELQSKGGKNSGVTRRRKRTLKQAAELTMSLPVSDPKVKAKLKKMGFDADDADNQMAVIVGLMGRAMKGDPKASALLFELLDDNNTSATEQTESHNALIDAIRKRNNED
jgi:hypothetical protein